MGLWNKLFGKRETDDDKLARARLALDDNEVNRAVAIVRDLHSASADEIRRRAHDMTDAQAAKRGTEREPEPVAHGPDPDDSLREGEPYRDPFVPNKQKHKQPKPRSNRQEALEVYTLAADGSQRIDTGAGDVVLNAPVSDDDGQVRSTDGLGVATRLLATVSEQPLDPRASAFIEAVLLFARAGDAPPRMTDPNRAALADLLVATVSGDQGRVIDAIRSGFERRGGDAMTWFAPMVAAKVAAPALGIMATQKLMGITDELVAALLATAPGLLEQLVEANPEWAGRALLAAEDAKVEVPGLAARWCDWKQIEDPEQRMSWLVLAVRREARRDLDAAIVLEAELESLEGPHFEATYAIASRLDRVRLQAILDAREPSVDHAGWFLGAVRGGVTECIDRWIDNFGAHTYDPYAYFETVLAACIEAGDLERTRRLLAKTGPTGWQVACAAWGPLARHPSREMLDVLYERHPPSVVAGRAIAREALPLAAGNVVIQPAWLDFRVPHPIETLALVVALGAEGPQWESPLAP